MGFKRGHARVSKHRQARHTAIAARRAQGRTQTLAIGRVELAECVELPEARAPACPSSSSSSSSSSSDEDEYVGERSDSYTDTVESYAPRSLLNAVEVEAARDPDLGARCIRSMLQQDPVDGDRLECFMRTLGALVLKGLVTHPAMESSGANAWLVRRAVSCSRSRDAGIVTWILCASIVRHGIGGSYPHLDDAVAVISKFQLILDAQAEHYPSRPLNSTIVDLMCRAWTVLLLGVSTQAELASILMEGGIGRGVASVLERTARRRVVEKALLVERIILRKIQAFDFRDTPLHPLPGMPLALVNSLQDRQAPSTQVLALECMRIMGQSSAAFIQFMRSGSIADTVARQVSRLMQSESLAVRCEATYAMSVLVSYAVYDYDKSWMGRLIAGGCLCCLNRALAGDGASDASQAEEDVLCQERAIDIIWKSLQYGMRDLREIVLFRVNNVLGGTAFFQKLVDSPGQHPRVYIGAQQVLLLLRESS